MRKIFTHSVNDVEEQKKFKATIYPETVKQFELFFYAESGKEAVKKLRDITKDEGVYFKMEEVEDTPLVHSHYGAEYLLNQAFPTH